MRTALAEQLGQGGGLLDLPRRAPDRPHDLCADDLGRLPAKRLEQTRVVTGHQVDRTLLGLFPGRPVREALVLRNPADRLVSQYNQFQSASRLSAQGNTVPSFDEWYERRSVPDFVVKWLARRLLVDRPTSNAVLEALSRMDFVSTTDDLPRTSAVLLGAIGLEPPAGDLVVDVDEEPAMRVDGELRARLEEENPDDHLLYAGIPVLQRLSLARLQDAGAGDHGGGPTPAGEVDTSSALPDLLERQWQVPARRGRRLTVFPDDVFVASYPRSGNTWVRFLIANLLQQDAPASPEYVGARVPDIYHVPDSELLKLPRPRYLKTHEPFHPRYPRVVYILRDPRDVASSYLNFFRRRNRVDEETTLDAFLPRFVDGKLPFGSWRDHVSEWITVRGGDADFLLVRYELLEEAPEGQLERIAAFLGIPPDGNAIRQAVERSGLDVMRALEEDRRQRGGTAEEGLRLGIAEIGTEAEDERSKGAMDLLVDRWAPTMRELGYL